jgi:hypothetical protein
MTTFRTLTPEMTDLGQVWLVERPDSATEIPAAKRAFSAFVASSSF